MGCRYVFAFCCSWGFGFGVKRSKSQAIGNISDNLSNAQTTGYKAIGTEFQDLVTSSSATDNSPGGVRATPLYQNDVQGTIASKLSRPLPIWRFPVRGSFRSKRRRKPPPAPPPLPAARYYTRAGDFTLNSEGYMVNGFWLSSFGLPDCQRRHRQLVNHLAGSDFLFADNPVPTSTVSYAANLPAGAANGFTSSASTIQVYDALGNQHQMSITWTDTGTDTWDANIDVANGLGTGTDYTATVPVTFNSDGTIGSIGAGSGYTVDLQHDGGWRQFPFVF